MEASLAPALHFTCGVVAGLLASAVTQPFDVVKTKMQLYPNQFTSFHQAIFYVNKKYGPQGFFKGLVPRMLRRTLMAAMAWTVYEQVGGAVGEGLGKGWGRVEMKCVSWCSKLTTHNFFSFTDV